MLVGPSPDSTWQCYTIITCLEPLYETVNAFSSQSGVKVTLERNIVRHSRLGLNVAEINIKKCTETRKEKRKKM